MNDHEQPDNSDEEIFDELLGHLEWGDVDREPEAYSTPVGVDADTAEVIDEHEVGLRLDGILDALGMGTNTPFAFEVNSPEGFVKAIRNFVLDQNKQGITSLNTDVLDEIRTEAVPESLQHAVTLIQRSIDELGVPPDYANFDPEQTEDHERAVFALHSELTNLLILLESSAICSAILNAMIDNVHDAYHDESKTADISPCVLAHVMGAVMILTDRMGKSIMTVFELMKVMRTGSSIFPLLRYFEDTFGDRTKGGTP